ncbi:MAG: DNA polymerase III subunit delta' [Chloroflexi bacterium]|nr:DNA polymerase III subunit delta' [Chloroflexota bacterium]
MKDNWGIVGHEWAVASLQRHIHDDRLHHAYLLAGPAGIGKRTLAMAFIKAALCEKRAGCGECRPCKLVEHQNHPDLLIVKPAVSGERIKTEKILVDRIRDELIVPITRKPVESRHRVGFIPNFEAANENAANAFLKTLEEPPDYALLALTTNDPESLLPTIRSRCEVFFLRPLPIAAIRDTLVQRRGATTERGDLLARLSGGRVGWAMNALSDDGHLLERREQRLEELAQLLSSSRAVRFAYAEALARDRESMRETLDLWLGWWRDVMLTASGGGVPPINNDHWAAVQAAAEKIGLDATAQTVESIQRTISLLPRNINARLALEVLLLDLPRI